jgi:tetratricopeptide (TPR) repeat protein
MMFSAKKMAAWSLVLGLGMGWFSRGLSQTANPQKDAELNKEAAQADSLFQSQNMLAAAPLYEDLHKQQPESNVWRERLALTLLSVAGTQQGTQAQTTRERAHKLLLEAKATGDNSNLLQVLLEKLETPAGSATRGPASPGADALARAEKAFSGGDLAGALKLYAEAATADPKMYEAPLFAGDAEYKLGHYPEADRWYAQAAAIDPNRETAYRYWGDCLMKQGDPTQAESKFIEAILAEPYSRTPRVGLKQWADNNHARLMAPPIALPARPSVGGKDKDGKNQININLDPSAMGSPASSAVLSYSMSAALWQGDKFHQTFPNEKQYRHSLAEEEDSIHTALAVLKEKIPAKKLDATWKTLLQLDKDGMLECWILLDHPDQGIAQDYVAYRATHRELLHAYIARYDVHPF